MILATGDVTDFLSINLTTIIATWLNLLILFLVLKHFLSCNNLLIKLRKLNLSNDNRADYCRNHKRAKGAEYNFKRVMLAKPDFLKLLFRELNDLCFLSAGFRRVIFRSFLRAALRSGRA